MDEEITAALALGRRAAASLSRQSKNNANTMSRQVWTVSAVNSGGTCDLYRGGTASDPVQELTGVPYTTGCVGIAAGSRALVDTYMHVPYVTGVLAG